MFILSNYLINSSEYEHASIFLGMREPLISEAVSDFQKNINMWLSLLRTWLEAGLVARPDLSRGPDLF